MLKNLTFFAAFSCGCAVALGQSGSGASEIYELSPIRVIAGDSLSERAGPTSAFTTGAVDLYQMQSVQETTGLVPNLFVASSETRGYGDSILLRGMGNTLFFSPAGVAQYIDDVPSGDVFTYSSELLSGNALTVHRGGKGTIFGRNGPAGVIEINSLKPMQEQRVEVGLEAGSFDKRMFRVNVSGPIAGSDVAHSLTVYHNERDGYITNASLGRETDSREARGAHYSLFFSPGEWNARLKLVKEDINDGSQRLSSLLSPDPFAVGSDLEGETQIERGQISLHFDRELGAGVFKSITALQDWELDPSTVDLDLSEFPISTSWIKQDQTLITQEFRWESDGQGNPVDWRTGIFFMDKDTSGETTRVFPIPGVSPAFTEDTIFSMDEQEIAAYGHAFFNISEELVLDIGVRAQETDTSINRVKTSLFGAAPVIDGQSDTYLSASAGFDFNLSEYVSIFGRSATGFKPRGYSAFINMPSMAAFADESSWSNEIGFAFAAIDDTVELRITGFDISIDDYQLERSVPQSTDYLVINADKVASQGIESEIVWRPIPSFVLEGGVGFNDVTFDRHIDPFSGADVGGLEVPFTPEYTIRGSARYSFANGFFLQGTFRSVGETFFDESNTGFFREGGYEVYDAQIGFRNEQFTVVVYGENLGDEFYYSFINPQIAAGTPGDPEAYGVRLDWRF